MLQVALNKSLLVTSTMILLFAVLYLLLALLFPIELEVDVTSCNCNGQSLIGKFYYLVREVR
jgi:hypothetical protein